MNVLLVGGSGFVGTSLAAELVTRGHDVTVLSRSPDDADLPAGVATYAGDATDYDAVEGAFEGQDAVVNLVALSPLFQPSGGNRRHFDVHLGATETAVRAAEAHDVSRFVQMSALGADPDGPTAYVRAKGQAEAVVRDSDLAWTVVRPSVVFGDGSEFVPFTRKLTTPFVTGLPGGGATRFQPIYVDDLAGMLADCVEDDAHVGETYELGGPETLTLAEVTKLVRGRVAVLPIPMALAKVGLTVGGAVPGFPMGPDQYRSLKFDNTVADNDVSAFGVDEADLLTFGEYLGGGSDAPVETGGDNGGDHVGSDGADDGAGDSSDDDRSNPLLSALFGRDVLVAFAVVLGLVLLMRESGAQVLQIPGYLVLIGFDALQNSLAPGLQTPYFEAWFGAYAYAIAIVAGALARFARGDGRDLRYPVAAVVAVLAVFAVVLGLAPLVWPAEYVLTTCTAAGECTTTYGTDASPNRFAVLVGLVGMAITWLLVGRRRALAV